MGPLHFRPSSETHRCCPSSIFFIAHWLISVFFQTFFLHRYGAHKQFGMSREWERCISTS